MDHRTKIRSNAPQDTRASVLLKNKFLRGSRFLGDRHALEPPNNNTIIDGDSSDEPRSVTSQEVNLQPGLEPTVAWEEPGIVAGSTGETGYCFSPEDMVTFGGSDAEMGWELSGPQTDGIFHGVGPLSPSPPPSLFSVFDRKGEKRVFEEEVVINQLRTNDPSLVTLDCSQLSCPSVQEAGEYSAWVARLIGSLNANTTLKYLSLCGFRLSVDDIMLLSKNAWVNNMALTLLDLSHIKLPHKGLCEIGFWLAENKTLKGLILDGIPLGSSVDIPLAIKANTSLSSLRVDYCDVTDDQPWIDAFCQNYTLTEFEGKIGNNNKFREGSDFAKIVEANQIITTLSQYCSNRETFQNHFAKIRTNFLADLVTLSHLAGLGRAFALGVKIRRSESREILHLALRSPRVTAAVVVMLLLHGALIEPPHITHAKELAERDPIEGSKILEIFEKLRRSDRLCAHVSHGIYRWCRDIQIQENVEIVVLSHNELTEIPGSFLTMLSSLPKLTTLDLSYNKLKSVPSDIALLPTLKYLDISYNPGINSLPPSLLSLSALKMVFWKGTRLDTLPEELMKRPLSRAFDYLEALQEPNKQWNTIKAIVIGQENVGKSHLISCLRQKPYRESSPSEVDIKGMSSRVPGDQAGRRVNILFHDFGRQAISYPTHEFYFNVRAIYLVVFKIPNLTESNVQYWLRKIKDFGRFSSLLNTPPPIILVGTHLDNSECTPSLLKFVSKRISEFQRSYTNIKGSFLVSCKQNSTIDQLREKVIQLATESKICKTLVPQIYLKLSQQIFESKRKYIHINELNEMAAVAHLTCTKMLKHMISFFHDAGIWVAIGSFTGVNNIFVLDCNWLANMFSSLVTVKFQNGLVPVDELTLAWSKDYPQDLHQFLRSILSSFEVMFPYRGGKSFFIVPSLLPETSPGFEEFTKQPKSIAMYDYYERIYEFNFMPVGIFALYVARILQLPSLVCHDTYRNGFLVSPLDLFTSANLGQDPAHDDLFQPVFAQCVKTALQSGYQQGRVKFIPNPQVPTLTISVWKHRRVVPATNDHNLLRDLVVTFEQLISDCYKRYEESIVRHCKLTTQSGKLKLQVEDVIKQFIAGEAFIDLDNKTTNNITRFESVADAPSDSPSVTFDLPADFKSRKIPLTTFAPEIMIDSELIPNNQVEITQELGRGGFGIVHKGILTKQLTRGSSPRLDRGPSTVSLDVAVKTLYDDESDPLITRFKGFQNEVQIMRGLDCPYLVHLYGIQTNPCRMLLEFVPGRDLSAVLHDPLISDTEFSWKIRQKFMLDIALGMEYLHCQTHPPIIHRDLRSPNIFVLSLNSDYDGVNCKIADFGLAQRVVVELSECFFTWQWMAPEVMTPNMTYNQRADIYSFGIVLWEIVSRAFPYWEYNELKDTQKRKMTPEQLADAEFRKRMKEDDWVVDEKTGEATRTEFKKHVAIEAVLEKELRPTIPTNVFGDIARLIQQCWKTSPQERPEWTKIIGSLLASLKQRTSSSDKPKTIQKDDIFEPPAPGSKPAQKSIRISGSNNRPLSVPSSVGGLHLPALPTLPRLPDVPSQPGSAPNSGVNTPHGEPSPKGSPRGLLRGHARSNSRDAVASVINRGETPANFGLTDSTGAPLPVAPTPPGLPPTLPTNPAPQHDALARSLSREKGKIPLASSMGSSGDYSAIKKPPYPSTGSSPSLGQASPSLPRNPTPPPRGGTESPGQKSPTIARPIRPPSDFGLSTFGRSSDPIPGITRSLSDSSWAPSIPGPSPLLPPQGIRPPTLTNPKDRSSSISQPNLNLNSALARHQSEDNAVVRSSVDSKSVTFTTDLRRGSISNPIKIENNTPPAHPTSGTPPIPLTRETYGIPPHIVTQLNITKLVGDKRLSLNSFLMNPDYTMRDPLDEDLPVTQPFPFAFLQQPSSPPPSYQQPSSPPPGYPQPSPPSSSTTPPAPTYSAPLARPSTLSPPSPNSSPLSVTPPPSPLPAIHNTPPQTPTHSPSSSQYPLSSTPPSPDKLIFPLPEKPTQIQPIPESNEDIVVVGPPLTQIPAGLLAPIKFPSSSGQSSSPSSSPFGGMETPILPMVPTLPSPRMAQRDPTTKKDQT